jgi:hypothetical protein
VGELSFRKHQAMSAKVKFDDTIAIGISPKIVRFKLELASAKIH